MYANATVPELRVTKTFAALILSVTLIGCPADRAADSTLRGAAVDVPIPMRDAPPPVLSIITRLRGPESAIHDPAQDVYFITNLHGGLQTIDNNGFITRVDAKTLDVQLKWIEGGRNGVTLDAPKGMAIVGETLWVADIKGVRKFDRRTGEPRGVVTLPGATLINDLTTDGTSVYVSDTGLRVAPGGTFYETGTDAIWKITNDRPEKIAAGAQLLHPNGIEFVDGKVWAVSFGPNELYAVDEGKAKTLAHLPDGQLDGVVRLDDGSVLISSWGGEGIYRGVPGMRFDPILTGMDTPADIGYDSKRHRLLVPNSGANQVTIHAVR